MIIEMAIASQSDPRTPNREIPLPLINMVVIWKGAAAGPLSKLGNNTQATPITSVVQALVDNYGTWMEIPPTKRNQVVPLHKRELDRPGSVT